MPKPNKLNSISPTQKLLQNYLVDYPVEAVKGLLGIGPSEYPPDQQIAKKINLFVQMLTAASPLVKAGLPFAALTKSNPVFHGTTNVFEKFDPSLYDKSDLLGELTHFSFDPEYANSYAQGFKKGSILTSLGRPNIIPAKVDAKNILDLVNPNYDDISQFVASQPKEDKDFLIRMFKYYKRNYPDDPKLFIQQITHGYLKKDIENKLLKTPFDAIYLKDMNKDTLAVPSFTPIKTPSGVPLN